MSCDAYTISLTQGYSAMASKEDFCRFGNMRWHAVRIHGKVYAARKEEGKVVYLHRQIVAAAPGSLVDHVNGNGLDNRRENIRLCSHSGNSRNARKRRDGLSSKYKGVCRPKGSTRFMAYIHRDGKHIHIGRFDTEDAAAMAYNAKAIELFGAFAKVNHV